MKKDNFIWYVLFGVGAYVAYNYYKNKKAKPTLAVADLSAPETPIASSFTFPEPFQRVYNIVMPSDLINKSVADKADALTAGRYEIQPEKVNAPLFV